jgi:tight adherence protein B
MLAPVLTVFVVVVGVFAGVYWLALARPEAAEHRQLRKRLRPLRDDAEDEEQKVVERPPGAERPPLDELLSKTGGLIRPLELSIERAGLTLGVSALLGLCVGAALIGAVVLARLSPNPLVAAPLGLCAGWLPYAWVRFKARRRVAQFEEQFPEAIELIARALRAGHAFTTGLALVAEELPDPVGAEFRLVYDRQNFGMPVADALHLFAERVPLIDARFFATAVLTQRESGGNLAEILDNLGSVIRQRFRVRRQIKVVTAHARLTGWVLVAMPLATAVAMLVVAPAHILTLVTDPVGIQMLIAALSLWFIGFLIIRRLVDVEY